MRDGGHDEIMRALGELQGSAQNVVNRLDKLNGSVLSLKLWRAYITGAVAVISIFVLPVLAWSLIQIVNIASKVSVVQAQVKVLEK